MRLKSQMKNFYEKKQENPELKLEGKADRE